jgi:hypothetical protein
MAGEVVCTSQDFLSLVWRVEEISVADVELKRVE